MHVKHGNYTSMIYLEFSLLFIYNYLSGIYFYAEQFSIFSKIRTSGTNIIVIYLFADKHLSLKQDEILQSIVFYRVSVAIMEFFFFHSITAFV